LLGIGPPYAVLGIGGHACSGLGMPAFCLDK